MAVSPRLLKQRASRIKLDKKETNFIEKEDIFEIEDDEIEDEGELEGDK